MSNTRISDTMRLLDGVYDRPVVVARPVPSRTTSKMSVVSAPAESGVQRRNSFWERAMAKLDALRAQHDSTPR